MKELLNGLKEFYDYIFIDSPPVGMVTDSQVLSTIADGTVLVAASGQVTIEALRRAKSLLENVNANILGVVVNMLERESNGYYYYYYYRHYDETEDAGKSVKRKKKEGFINSFKEAISKIQ